jgi:hypothetical protein
VRLRIRGDRQLRGAGDVYVSHADPVSR